MNKNIVIVAKTASLFVISCSAYVFFMIDIIKCHFLLIPPVETMTPSLVHCWQPIWQVLLI